MRTVWKHDIDVTDGWQEVRMPSPAIFLHAAIGPTTTPGCISLWFDVVTGVAAAYRRYRVHGTGHPMENSINAKWVATVVDPTQPLVWHVFEEVVYP